MDRTEGTTRIPSGLLANLVQIRDAVSVPVIVKETGCGIAAEQYELLLEQGFTAFDCAGAGGTNSRRLRRSVRAWS